MTKEINFIRSIVQKNTEKEKEKHGPITIVNCSFPTDVDAFATDFDFFILGDPGAVSRAGRKGATKVFKHRRKSPWVPTLTGPFPNGQVNGGS